MKLCSACLMGINCRYDGKNKLNKKIAELTRYEILIPVCPEQLGGLPTPRERTEQRGDRVVTVSGKDVTENFISGTREVLKIAERHDIRKAIFKKRSPACGSGEIYDGTFSGRLVPGDGVTAAWLKKRGIEVVTEDALQKSG